MDILTEAKFDSFTVYFLAFDHSNGTFSQEDKRTSIFGREGVLELTHNHGTESDPEFKGYASGNEDIGRGFGHIAITVDDIEKACARLEQLDVPFKKRPSDGKMKDIAFVLDPDGYWVELVTAGLKF